MQDETCLKEKHLGCVNREGEANIVQYVYSKAQTCWQDYIFEIEICVFSIPGSPNQIVSFQCSLWEKC
jgi:hypothetical protein